MHTSSSRERFDGYRRAVGGQFRPDLVATGAWSLRRGRAGAEQLLGRCAGLRRLFIRASA